MPALAFRAVMHGGANLAREVRKRFRSVDGEDIETEAMRSAEVEEILVLLKALIANESKLRQAAIAERMATGHQLLRLYDLIPYGEREGHVKALGLQPRTAWNWMRLAETGLTPREVVAAGGQQRVLKQRGLDKMPKLQRCGHLEMLRAPSKTCCQCEWEKNPCPREATGRLPCPPHQLFWGVPIELDEEGRANQARVAMEWDMIVDRQSPPSPEQIERLRAAMRQTPITPRDAVAKQQAAIAARGVELLREHSPDEWRRQVQALDVVPRDVVYSREAGVVPPMPPCGRR